MKLSIFCARLAVMIVIGYTPCFQQKGGVVQAAGPENKATIRQPNAKQVGKNNRSNFS
jgi:hypothetical protein